MHGGDHHDGTTFSLNLKDLNIISALGRGAKGVVFLVRTQGDGKLRALKAISRSSVEKKKHDKTTGGSSSGRGDEYRRIWFERDVLGSFNHPLLPKLHGVLVTDKIVGYAVDYCPGRDLNYLRKKQTEKMFSDDIIRFYAAELVLGLEYLHGLGIVYRDLKPENVMIQENGHLMLVDFDLSTKLQSKSAQTSPMIITKPDPDIKPSRKKKSFCISFNRRDPKISPKHSATFGANSTSSGSDSTEKSNSFVGTEEYVAPEIIRGDGHDFSVDWWCLGVVLYELLYGTTPFRGVNRKETFYRIITKQPDLTGELTPLRDLIGKLLEKDPRKRISVGEIRGHDFFKAVDWDLIVDMPRPPFIPELTEAEGSEGHEKLDVESYVQRVFAAKEEGKMENVQKSDEENQNRDMWVHNHPSQIQHDHFRVF
ncbi:serine/threonine-protein kinase OXI1-like [Primulina eburnea]|uniref:serine/threonine-protein kinase OXI1-like n=1 Tax=Primulina eburnea TaxID=1245227 RepID=UPI003C6C5C64